MDSVTQIALGAAVSEAVMNNKVGRKASLIGAICGTLPDLDVLIPMGDAVKDFTYHRAESHSLFYMTLATPIILFLVLKIYPDTKKYWKHWTLLIILSLFTHSLLDSFTTYGTQMLLPFSNYPIGWNTIFVIDPLYTLPLLIGVLVIIFHHKWKLARLFNYLGIIISSIYLLTSVTIKAHVNDLAERSLSNQNISVNQFSSTPAPFNIILWRIIGMTDSGYVEGFYSLFDNNNDIQFTKYESDNYLLNSISDSWHVQRLQWFTKGYYKVSLAEEKIIISDIRMGLEPLYFFQFVVGEKKDNFIGKAKIEKLAPQEFDSMIGLNRLWDRIFDDRINPIFKE